MLDSADFALLERDPQLVGLPLLLNPDHLGSWLSDRTGIACSVAPGRIRYKPATSCVMSFDLQQETDGDTGYSGACIAKAYTAETAVKIEKSIARAPEGTLIAFDSLARVLVTTFGGDRRLPALRRLSDSRTRDLLLRQLLPDRHMPPTPFRTVRYNPERRWVARLDSAEGPVLLRAYRREEIREHRHAYSTLEPGPPATPSILGSSVRHAVAAVEWVQGSDLAGRPAGLTGWRHAGTALARLHGRSGVRLPRRTPTMQAHAVRASGEQVARLLPELAPEAEDLSRAITACLATLDPGSAVLHGDFSGDQVVLDESDRATLIDLDSACLGDPAADLGCCWAALVRTPGMDPATARPLLDALYAGYDAAGRLPDAQRLRIHGAAFLLQQAVEPFRSRQPDWRGQIRRLVGLARQEVDTVTSETGRPW